MTALKVLLTCCLLTFSYFVTFYYTAMIKTDMVTVKTPRVIASYQDILDDPSIRPYIRHTFDEYKSFKQAPLGSVKRKIWNRIVKMGVNRLVYNDESNSDGDEDIRFLRSKNPVMYTKAVIMAYTRLVYVVKYMLGLHLKIVEEWKNRRGLYVSDPTDSDRLSASVINSMSDEVISIKYQKRMRRFFEGHFWYKITDNTGVLWAQHYGDMMGLGKDISDADQYVNEKVLLPEPELVKQTITYFTPLFILYLVFCCVQFILFVIERWVSDRD